MSYSFRQIILYYMGDWCNGSTRLDPQRSKVHFRWRAIDALTDLRNKASRGPGSNPGSLSFHDHFVCRCELSNRKAVGLGG